MPDPAELPVELYSVILDLALQPDIQHLCGLSLLNRKWHLAMLDRIYHEWAYNGARHSFMRLWKFVRILRTNPHIAALVRTLNIGNWGFYPRTSQSPSPLQFLPDEKEIMSNAIHDAGLNDLEEGIFESLSKRDRRPLIVILLASVPNLSTLYAHVPPSDPILGTFMKRTLDFQISSKPSCSLSKLKELYLFPEVEPPLDIAARSDLKLDYLWPAFYLPSLRALSLFRLNSDKAAEYLGYHAAVSHVEDLYLIGDKSPVLTSLDTQALLTRTEGLKSLFLYLDEGVHGPDVSNSDIWNYLQKHKDSLQTIDIYRDAMIPGGENGYFGPFREFQSLMSLGIQTETLLGGALFRLQEVLPSKIQALTLYDTRAMGDGIPPDLPKQIQELLEGQFPSLRSITLEIDSVYYGDREVMEPYLQLKEICFKREIIFRIDDGGKLPKGGSFEGLWTETFYLREDGYRRYSAVSYMPKELRDSEELLLRSAEEAEEDDDEASDSADEYGHFSGKVRRLKVHTIPFIDRRNKMAYMVFENLESFPLPPLYSFAIYFTHPNATPNMADFHQELTENGGGDEFDVRFDMYFLPSATHEDCISHYNNEKATRGSYLDQVQIFKQCDRGEVHPLPETSPVVPGMVNKYHMANQVLYISSEKDWCEGNQTLCDLRFKEPANADTIPAFRATDRPMTRNSPAYRENRKTPVAVQMFEMAHPDRDHWYDAWQIATSRGWTGW